MGKTQSDIDLKIIAQDGRYFTQEFADLNMDEILDVLVSIGSYGEQQGQLVIYPGQYSNSTGYSLGNKILVYDQFPFYNSKSLSSPGASTPFWNGEKFREKGVIPSLLISGNSDGNIYMAIPILSDKDFNFQYTM